MNTVCAAMRAGVPTVGACKRANWTRCRPKLSLRDQVRGLDGKLVICGRV